MLKRLYPIYSAELSLSNHKQMMVVIGHIFFAFYILLSLILYQERTLHFDTANYLIHLIYNQDFYIAHGRLINYLPQSFTLLMIASGVSLKTLLIFFSLIVPILFYGLFNLIVYVFKNPAAGLFLALSLCLSMRYKFYAPVSELTFSIALSATLIAWITKGGGGLKNWKEQIIAALLALALMTTHPFALFPILIFYGFEMIYSQRWREIPYWGLILFTILLFTWEYWTFSGGTYASLRFGSMKSPWDVLLHPADYYVWDRIIWFFDSEYIIPFLAFLLFVGGLFWEKKWFSGVYILLTFIGLLSLIAIMHSYLSARVYLMLDGYLALLGFLWAIPILYALNKRRQIWILVLIFSLLFFGLHRIYNKRSFFQERKAYLEKVMDLHTTPSDRKLLAHMDEFYWRVLWYPWAIGVETLLMTNLDEPDNPRTLYYQQHGEKVQEPLEEEEAFLGLHYKPDYFEIDSFPKHLIKLPKGAYKKIKL